MQLTRHHASAGLSGPMAGPTSGPALYVNCGNDLNENKAQPANDASSVKQVTSLM